MARTTCGAAKPTKAIKPSCATAVAVANESTPTSTTRMGASGKPRLKVVDSPKLSASNKGLSHAASALHNSSTASINPQAGQLTNAVEPNTKPCMPCNTSGRNKVMRDDTAPSTTPTITPANNKRKLCCTPRANTSVSTTANTAPPNAMPVSPTCSHNPVATLGPNSANPSATPSDAPEALPNKYGSAKGLRNKPCASAPASPNKAPPTQAPTERGKRMSHTICHDSGSCHSVHTRDSPVLPTALPAIRPNTLSTPNTPPKCQGRRACKVVPSVRLMAHLARCADIGPSVPPLRPCADRDAPAHPTARA